MTEFKYNFNDVMNGLFAYDTGCVDSGIKDPILRDWFMTTCQEMSDEEFNDVMCEYVLKHFLSPEARKQGYGFRDVEQFCNWLYDLGLV